MLKSATRGTNPPRLYGAMNRWFLCGLGAMNWPILRDFRAMNRPISNSLSAKNRPILHGIRAMNRLILLVQCRDRPISRDLRSRRWPGAKPSHDMSLTWAVQVHSACTKIELNPRRRPHWCSLTSRRPFGIIRKARKRIRRCPNV